VPRHCSDGFHTEKGNVSPQIETSCKKADDTLLGHGPSIAVEDSSTAAVFEAYLESATKSPAS
jgi:hypothetical protein